MSYTFRNTEINNEKASVFETKSLLYLIGKSNCRKEIEYITFDCFNDVSVYSSPLLRPNFELVKSRDFLLIYLQCAHGFG